MNHSIMNETISLPSVDATMADDSSSNASTTTSRPSSPTNSNGGGDEDNNNDACKTGFLPEDFEPTEMEIILGRGKQVASHPGNKRFKVVVLSHLKEYSAAQTKALKSNILSHIVNKIRNSSVHQAGFVKQDNATGRWMIAEDSAARIATAQIFRDHLADSYKSSKSFKQQRRQDRKGLAKKRKQLREQQEQQQLEKNGLLVQQSMGLPPLALSTSEPSFPNLSSVGSSNNMSPLLQQQQDRFAGNLNCVLDQLRVGGGGGSGSNASFYYNHRTSTPAPAPDSIMSVLMNHFGTKVDASSNPFEPTPISEEAIILPTSSGFKLKDRFSHYSN